MAKILFCRYPDCHRFIKSVAGVLPDTCPTCQREARWTTEQPKDITTPTYVMTYMDRRFLQSLKIDPT